MSIACSINSGAFPPFYLLIKSVIIQTKWTKTTTDWSIMCFQPFKHHVNVAKYDQWRKILCACVAAWV